jgi:hypothetical protein
MNLWFRARLSGSKVNGWSVSLRFDPHAETAYVQRTGPSALLCVIPTPNSNMTKRDAIRLRGFGLHEMGHPKWQPDIFDIMEKYPTKKGSPLGGIYNVFLDVHNETLTADDYAGDAKALSEFGAVVGHDVYEKLAPRLKATGGVFPTDFEKMCMVMTSARNAEATWNVGMMVGFDKLVNDLYTKEIRDVAGVLERKFNITDRLVTNATDTDEWHIWDLSKDVYAYLWEKDPEEEIGGGGGAGGKPEKGEGEKQEGEASSAKGGKAGNDGEEEAEQQDEKIPIDELLFSDHYETMVGGGGTGQGFDYTNYKKHAKYTPVDPASFKVTDYANKRGRR